MNTLLLLQPMLVLLGMMGSGYIAFKMDWLDKKTAPKVTKLIVNLFNPFMIFSSIAGKKISDAGDLLFQNLILAILFFPLLILAGFLYIKIRRFDRAERSFHMLLFTLPNLGFMGIPLVRAIYGSEYIIFIAFYLLIFNVLIYTLGVYFARRINDTQNRSFRIREIINPGTVSCVVSILFFLLQLEVPAPVQSFCSYMGDMAIPLSMMIIGVSLAQMGLGAVVTDKDAWIFVLLKMLLIPAVGARLTHLLPFHPVILSIFRILLSMPVAAITGMLAAVYGGDGSRANRIVALTTLLSVVTIPLVSLI